MSTTAPAPVEGGPGSPAVATPGGETLGAYARRWWAGVKAGDLGSLPIVVGLIIIAIVFQSQNSNFLTAGNFVNLIVQAAAFTTIGHGHRLRPAAGGDRPVGRLRQRRGGRDDRALLTLPDNSHVFAAGPTLVIALVVGLAIGVLQGLIITKVGIPSFVVTLAGLLAWNGVVLLLIGDRGTVIIQNGFFVGFANDFLPSGTAVDPRHRRRRALCGDAVLAAHPARPPRARQRARRGARAPRRGPGHRGPRRRLRVQQGPRHPVRAAHAGGLFILWTYVLNRTRFGRHIYAVGGNAEAARRAGINVDNIKIACFAICSMMAALGGIVLASRLRSVDTGAGGGSILLYSIAAPVIGGTSLFGGRGNIKSAVLGALVIASIDNGLGLLGLSAGTKFVITAGVLLLAVTVDSVARKGRASSGRA